MEEQTFNYIVYGWIIIAMILIPLQLKITVPYGRYARKDWGMTIPNRFGWVIMELPALLVFLYFFFDTQAADRDVSWIFAGLWFLHYTNRSIIFPFRIKTSGKEMPVVIMAAAIVFNVLNGYLNGYYLGSIDPAYPVEWLKDMRFISGIVLFITGLAINWYSDKILINLRKNAKNGYALPTGGLFRYLSCPNYFGEIVEWTGFALMTWSLPALAFVIWSAANLVPRALHHHIWYQKSFANYPANRKAIFPFIL